MITKNNDESVEINPNPNRPYVPDHPYKILIIAGSGLGKIDMLLNLIHYQLTDIEYQHLKLGLDYSKSKDQKITKNKNKQKNCVNKVS